MNFWNQLPLLKILIPFATGIIIALTGVNLYVNSAVLCGFSLLIFTLIFFYKRIIKNYKYRWIIGVSIFLFIFFSSFQLTYHKLQKNPTDLFFSATGNDTLIVTVTEPASLRENTVRITVECNAIKSGKIWKQLSGSSLIYFEKDSASQKINYGDKLLVCGYFDSTKSPLNPGEFNYKKYLSYKEIYTQGYVKSSKWHTISTDEGSIVKSYALKIRAYFLDIFSVNKIEGNEFGVVAAILLGYTDKLDADLMKNYANTGVMHVLCVSGMHVGVIYLGLGFLLFFLDKRKSGKITKAILLIGIIWFYAAITGFSPAVNRAAAMITFVIIGKSFGRFTNIYNTLAASALFLLLLNPLVITDLGFQLSYIAVLGIVIFQKPISSLWYPKPWLIKQIWMLVAVSVAAQIATLPVSIYYFHQFPNYFLISNILIIPFANIVIYNGILLLILSPVSAIANILAAILNALLLTLNSAIKFIDSMPYSTSTGLHITTAEMLFLYFMIVFIILFFVLKKNLFFRGALVMVIHFLVSYNLRYVKALQSKEFIVYSVKKSSALGFISHRKHVLLSDTILFSNKKAQNYFLENGLLNKGVVEREEISQSAINTYQSNSDYLFIKNNFLQFYDKKIVIINKSNYKHIYSGQIELDYLVISENIKTDIGPLLQTYKAKLVIFDSSNSAFKTEKWINECKTENIPFYSVQLNGAYVSEI